MAIAVSCTCGRKFRAKDDYVGRRTRCPACSSKLVIAGERLPDHDVFISYSSKDKAVADAICASLEERRIRCWIAPRDVRPGMEWSSAIIDAISDSAVMVLVFTGNANESPQVLREIERAVNKGVSIVPLRLEAGELSKSMEYFISASHWLDAVTPPLEQHLERLAVTIEATLSRRKAEGLDPSVLPGGAGSAADPSRRRKWLALSASAAVVLVAIALIATAGRWRDNDRSSARNTTNPSEVQPSKPATAPVPPPDGIVDLLPLVDVVNDAIEGRWRFEDGRLVVDNTRFARLVIRYPPPKEYDFRIEFVRLQGQNDVAMLLEVDGRRCAWQMAGNYGRTWGLDAVNERMIGIKSPPQIIDGQRHVALTEVRSDTINAYFDGKLVLSVPTKSRNLEMPSRWSTFGKHGLGLGACASPTAFYSVRLIDIGARRAKPQ